MRRFELVEGKSSKYWEVQAEGCTVTVRFGRMGTNGQTQTKTFADEAAALKEQDKLIRAKTAKGYAEAPVAAGAALAAVAPKEKAAPLPHLLARRAAACRPRICPGRRARHPSRCSRIWRLCAACIARPCR